MNAVGPSLNRIREFFFEAIEADPFEPNEFMASRCADLREDERSELLALLKAHDSAGAFLGDPTAANLAGSGPSDFSAPSSIPSTIGSYKLLKVLGSGGFGSVYLADQDKPLRRQVALKLIKPGMDTAQVIKRFDGERLSLALMDHPNIARVFDAGQTAAGRPWFAMEYVDGPQITDYCRQQSLSIEQILGLFVSVCQGVQHAHQKGIIHRDLKPANVLVASSNKLPIPKVIDFGIAKALTGPLTDLTLTAENQRGVGTPQYMSPEQASGSNDVDTRTDVYALGALLFELLTGLPPFDTSELRRNPWDEQLRILREETPLRASVRLSAAAKSQDNAIVNSRLDRLVRELRQDLDWVILRAMEKDPARRYTTVENLISDVQRYLSHEPLMAGPPAKSYRLKKFVTRHRRALTFAAVFAVTVALGATVATVGWIRARDERIGRLQQEEIATARLALVEQRQQQLAMVEKTARRRGDVVVAAQNALTTLFLPRKDESREETQANLNRLDLVAARLDNGHLSVPEELAGPLRSVLAFTYQAYEKYDLAVPQAGHAVEIYRKLGPTVRHKLAEDLMQQANSLSMLDRFAEAEVRIAEAVELFKETDPNAPTAKAPIAMLNHALVKLYREDEIKARELADQAIKRTHEIHNADPRDEATILRSFIIGLKNKGNLKAAEEYQRRLDKLPK